MRLRRILLLICALIVPIAVVAPAQAHSADEARVRPQLLAAGLDGALGSTIGPDGALYVAEGVAGRLSRIDLRTGARSTVASGFPQRIFPVGGAMDVAFLGRTAYVLVTIVSPDVGGTAVDGIYRVDGPHTFTVIADIGAWSLAHPPVPPFFIPTGVQFALQPYKGGFLVTDGHHNRVLRVTLDGQISELAAFPDIVPTGITLRGRTAFFTEAGPVPHLPADGKVLALDPRTGTTRVLASGAPLLVDVKLADGSMYALSQGHFTPGHAEGTPADPNTGALERVGRHGTMTPVATGLDRPASMQIVGHTAYIVNLAGEVWTIRMPCSSG